MAESEEVCAGHDEHLCHLASHGMQRSDPREYAGLVHDPQFVCKNCGRVAGNSGNLCNPVELGSWN